MAREAELDQTEADQHEQRELISYQDADGMWVIHARLPAEEGSLVMKAIDALANPVQAEKREQRLTQQGNPDVSAETFSEMEKRGSETFRQSHLSASRHEGSLAYI